MFTPSSLWFSPVCPTVRSALVHCGLFMQRHFWHWLLLIPGMWLFTLLHESAHAGMVLWQGGSITEFSVLPSQEIVHHPHYGRYTEWAWGHVSYSFKHHKYSEALIALAPYVLMSFLMLTAALSAAFVQAPPFWLASSIFVWLFCAPGAEIGNELLPYLLLHYEGDFFAAFQQPRPLMFWLAALWLLLCLWLGYWIQARLYWHRALRPAAYFPFAGFFLALFCVLIV